MRITYTASGPLAGAFFVIAAVVLSSCGSSSASGGTTTDSGNDVGSGSVFSNVGVSCGSEGVVDASSTEAKRAVTYTATSITPNCIVVTVGQTIKFDGDFENDPLRQDAMYPGPFGTYGTTPTEASITFPNAGIFPYHPQNEATVVGAVQVLATP